MAAVCAPGTYVYLYTAADSAGNLITATVTVYLVERSAVSFELRLSSTSQSAETAEAEAEALLQTTSPSNVVYRQSIAALLNDRSDALRAGAQVAMNDVNITHASVELQSAGYSLVVGITVYVQSLAPRRLRHLLQSSAPGDAAADVAALIQASVGPNGAGEGASLTSYLNASAAAAGVDVAVPDGLAANASSTRLTPQVDQLAALEAAMRSQWQLLHASGAVTQAAVGAVNTDLANMGSLRGLPEQSLLPHMDEMLQNTQPLTNALYDSSNEITKKVCLTTN